MRPTAQFPFLVLVSLFLSGKCKIAKFNQGSMSLPTKSSNPELRRIENELEARLLQVDLGRIFVFGLQSVKNVWVCKLAGMPKNRGPSNNDNATNSFARPNLMEIMLRCLAPKEAALERESWQGQVTVMLQQAEALVVCFFQTITHFFETWVSPLQPSQILEVGSQGISDQILISATFYPEGQGSFFPVRQVYVIAGGLVSADERCRLCRLCLTNVLWLTWQPLAS